MNDLPTEIIDAIIKYIDLETRFNLALVNRELNNIVKRHLKPENRYQHNGKILWKVWSCAHKERHILYHDEISHRIWYDSWYKDGQLDRECKPAEIKWYSNGKKARETWCKNNKFHREEFPAYTTWYENGQKLEEFWYENNKLLRESRWYEDGTVNHNSYSLFPPLRKQNMAK